MLKTLIVTTGAEPYLYITIKGLRTNGKYKGDITVIKYETDVFTEGFTKFLEENNVKVEHKSREYYFLVINRWKAFNDVIMTVQNDYDIIMLLGHDMIIYEDVNPLFEEAFNIKKIGIVQEQLIHGKERMGRRYKDWTPSYRYPVKEQKWWGNVGEMNLYNPDLIVATPELLLDFLNFLFTKFEDKYAMFGVDQLLTGVYAYLYPDKVNTLSCYWGYIPYWTGWVEVDGKCTCITTRESIKILHAIDTHIYKDKPVEEGKTKPKHEGLK